LESFQKRKKCAIEVLSIKTPNAFRNRENNGTEEKEEFQESDFTNLEDIDNLEDNESAKENGKMRLWPSKPRTQKYVVQHPPKTLQWSSNLQQNFRKKS